jgi:hypothetical protein
MSPTASAILHRLASYYRSQNLFIAFGGRSSPIATGYEITNFDSYKVGDGQQWMVAHVWIRSIRNYVGSEHNRNPPQDGTATTGNSYATSTNRIDGASYDAAGNLLAVGGSNLSYDAENRITTVSQPGVGTVTYA